MQSCGGTNNMTAYTYGYNINSTLAYETDDIDLGQQP
jgi:hypothetical protein